MLRSVKDILFDTLQQLEGSLDLQADYPAVQRLRDQIAMTVVWLDVVKVKTETDLEAMKKAA